MSTSDTKVVAVTGCTYCGAGVHALDGKGPCSWKCRYCDERALEDNGVCEACYPYLCETETCWNLGKECDNEGWRCLHCDKAVRSANEARARDEEIRNMLVEAKRLEAASAQFLKDIEDASAKWRTECERRACSTQGCSRLVDLAWAGLRRNQVCWPCHAEAKGYRRCSMAGCLFYFRPADTRTVCSTCYKASKWGLETALILPM